MSGNKKDFTTGAAAGSTSKQAIPKEQEIPTANKTQSSVKKGLKRGETRKTYIINEDLAEQLDAVAFWERKNIKDVANEAIRKYINEYALDNKNKQNVLPTLQI